jgi:CDGSH-type Zn-finger protein
VTLQHLPLWDFVSRIHKLRSLINPKLLSLFGTAISNPIFIPNNPGDSMSSVKITAKKDGPFRVEGPEGAIELVDSEGNKYDLTGKPAFSLCRCGGSVNKPFCDGTHSKIGFQGAELAVKKADQGQPQ